MHIVSLRYMTTAYGLFQQPRHRYWRFWLRYQHLHIASFPKYSIFSKPLLFDFPIFKHFFLGPILDLSFFLLIFFWWFLQIIQFRIEIHFHWMGFIRWLHASTCEWSLVHLFRIPKPMRILSTSTSSFVRSFGKTSPSFVATMTCHLAFPLYYYMNVCYLRVSHCRSVTFRCLHNNILFLFHFFFVLFFRLFYCFLLLIFHVFLFWSNNIILIRSKSSQPNRVQISLSSTFFLGLFFLSMSLCECVGVFFITPVCYRR